MKLARPSRRFRVSIFLLPLPPFRMANLCMDFNSRLDTESREINSYKEHRVLVFSQRPQFHLPTNLRYGKELGQLGLDMSSFCGSQLTPVVFF